MTPVQAKINSTMGDSNFKNLSSPLSGSKMQSDYKDKIFHRNEINSRIKELGSMNRAEKLTHGARINAEIAKHQGGLAKAKSSLATRFGNSQAAVVKTPDIIEHAAPAFAKTENKASGFLSKIKPKHLAIGAGVGLAAYGVNKLLSTSKDK